MEQSAPPFPFDVVLFHEKDGQRNGRHSASRWRGVIKSRHKREARPRRPRSWEALVTVLRGGGRRRSAKTHTTFSHTHKLPHVRVRIFSSSRVTQRYKAGAVTRAWLRVYITRPDIKNKNYRKICTFLHQETDSKKIITKLFSVLLFEHLSSDKQRKYQLISIKLCLKTNWVAQCLTNFDLSSI